MWTITRLRLKRDRRGVSNIIVVALSLVIILVIVSNIVLWSYEMNQLDWEKMKEDMTITNVERVSRSSWFVAQSEYTVNTGSHISGTYTDTQVIDGNYESFRETFGLSYNPSGYILGGSTSWLSGSVSDLTSDDGVYMAFRSYSSGTDTSDFVDNNTSDVDSSADKGTHSNFTAQQAGLDSIYDTLTEENTGGGSITYINGAEASATSGTSAQVNKPTGTAEDDFMIALLVSTIGSDTDGSTMSSAPSGWTNEYDYIQTAFSGQHVYIYWKVAGASEPSSYTWTWTSSCGWIAQITTFRGVDTSSPIHVEGTVNQESSSSPMSPSVTTTEDNSMIWLYDMSDDNDVPAGGGAPGGTTWIDQTEVASPGNGIGISTAYFVQASAGATGNQDWTLDASEENSGQQYALKPAGTDYQLDLEVQWTNADYDETNEELAIYVDKGSNTYSLDATGGYMIIGDGSPDWGSTTGTISFWIKMDTSVQGRFWGQDTNMETRWSGTNLVLDWGATGSMTSAYSFSADTWYFAAIVWDENNDNLFLYIGDENNAPTLDGNSLSGTWTSTTPAPTENRFMNGLGVSEPVDGHGDDLRYWNIARNLAEIQSDYNMTLSGSEPNLRSYFKLDNNFDDIGPDNNDGSGSGSYSFSSDVPFDASPTENIRVDAWNGATWQNLFTDLTNGWNNVSVSSYLNSSTFTIRFNGSNETSDTAQDSWNIDVTLLHVWSNEYTLEVEFTGSSNTEDWSQLNWAVDSAWTTGSVNVNLQLYNYTLDDYPTSGNGYISYSSSATANTDETQSQTITQNPTDFRNATGYWKMKVKGVKATDTSFDFKADWVEFSPTGYQLDLNGTFAIDLSTYPVGYIQTVEIQLRYMANDTGEKWYLKAYNWSSSTYSDSGFNSTTGHTPTTGWDYYAVNLTDEWQSYVQNNGTIYVKFVDEGADSNQTTIDIDFLGVRAEINGTRFTFKNEGALTSHLVSLWIINSTNHQRYDTNVFVNSADTTTYLRADISLPTGQYTVKVITERGNTAVYSGS